MAKSATGKRMFNCDANTVYALVLKAVAEMKGVSVKSSDPGSRTIEAKSGVTLTSWGEAISIRIVPVREDCCEVEVTSSSVLVTTLIDYGKNQSNVDKIFQTLAYMVGT